MAEKTGILSMQRIRNYGSFLQAYGLKKLIENIDKENKVEFVDYHVEAPIIKDENEKKGFSRKINKVVEVLKDDAKLIHKLQYIRYKRNYDRKYLSMLGVNENTNYNPKLDTLVIGSDEVFNCIQKNSNVGYSLELFGKNNNANKLISYAASFGNTTYEKLEQYNKTGEISELLNKFDAISVRDSNSKNVVEKLTNKKVNVNLDPVLMYDYLNECKEIPNINVKEKYMILYAYNGRITRKESDYIKKYAKENKLKIYSIGGVQNCTDKFIDCNPFEVLAYFKNAEFIVTDTFHGSIFSIINNKKFTTLVRKSVGNAYGNEEKLTALLKQLNLESQIIYDIKEMNSKVKNDINYSDVNAIIKEQRINTFNYLKDNL